MKEHTANMQQQNHKHWLDEVRWGQDGLVPVITQDVHSGRVLTHAWVNRDALRAALDEGRAVYWSRSRSKLWRKGEESGNVQKIHRILLDCDADTVCYVVEQIGGIACHTGRESCFYRVLEPEASAAGQQWTWRVSDPVLKDPALMYGKPSAADSE